MTSRVTVTGTVRGGIGGHSVVGNNVSLDSAGKATLNLREHRNADGSIVLLGEGADYTETSVGTDSASSAQSAPVGNTGIHVDTDSSAGDPYVEVGGAEQKIHRDKDGNVFAGITNGTGRCDVTVIGHTKTTGSVNYGNNNVTTQVTNVQQSSALKVGDAICLLCRTTQSIFSALIANQLRNVCFLGNSDAEIAPHIAKCMKITAVNGPVYEARSGEMNLRFLITN